MASEALPVTPYNIQLSAAHTPGNTHVDGLTQESADRTSELLLVNHVRHHSLYNEIGFHNHIVHHLLALWALGATPSEVQAMWDLNKPYQALMKYRPVGVVEQMRDPEFFRKCIGTMSHYPDFMRFFQDEIAQKGVPHVVNEYLLKGDAVADDILARMHAGFLHPLIELGCALEFGQPCLVAQSLAAACIHDEWTHLFLFPTEKYIREHPELPVKSLLEIAKELRSDSEILAAIKREDPLNKIKEGLLKRVPDRLVSYLAQYRVQPTQADLEQKTKEMMQTSALIMGAAQNPVKAEGIDFLMMHGVTLGLFYQTFLKQDWISPNNKRRLLEWKVWSDAVNYAGNVCPVLYTERITNYTPKRPQDGWPELIHRAIVYGDDGHASKIIRALLATERLGEPEPGFPLRKKDFVKIAHMTLDTIERLVKPGEFQAPESTVRWVRWCGLDGAWDNFPDLEKSDDKVVASG